LCGRWWVGRCARYTGEAVADRIRMAKACMGVVPAGTTTMSSVTGRAAVSDIMAKAKGASCSFA
jgi:hypothetical protein